MAERLARISQRLNVHVLVADGELIEIAAWGVQPAVEPLELPLEDLGKESEHSVAVRQLEIPARIMRDRAGIPKRVGSIENGCRAMNVTQRPIFVKPADMADLPEHRVDDGQHRPHQLLR